MNAWNGFFHWLCIGLILVILILVCALLGVALQGVMG